MMGKQDGAPQGLGAILVTDAARRAYRSLDIPGWGLAVQPEGGPENKKLWEWYQSLGFFPAKTRQDLMYGAYKSLIPAFKG